MSVPPLPLPPPGGLALWLRLSLRGRTPKGLALWVRRSRSCRAPKRLALWLRLPRHGLTLKGLALGVIVELPHHANGTVV